MPYDELKEALINKGADAKLLDMPAVRERLESSKASINDITINPDGTFNFGNFILQKETIEREEDVPVLHNDTDPILGEENILIYTTYEKQKVTKDVLTIVEHFEKEQKKNQALDNPDLSDNYEPTYKEPAVKLTIVDNDGIEIESYEIDNGLIVNDALNKGTLNNKTFEDYSERISDKYTRSKGIVTEEKAGKTWKFYDSGSWKIEGHASIGTKEGDSPALVIKGFENESQKLLKKYPNLHNSVKKEKEN